MINLEWESEVVINAFKKMADNSEMSNLFPGITKALKKDQARLFGIQQTPEGNPWEPNKKGTTVLWGIGNLFEETQKDSNYRLVGNDMYVYNSHPGAGTHQWGLPVRIWGRDPAYKFPERTYLGPSPTGEKELLNEVFVRISYV